MTPFLMIFRRFPTPSEDFRRLFRIPDERFWTFSNNFRKFPKMSEDFRRLPNTSEEDPKMFRWYTNQFKYNVRDKPDVIERRWHTENTPLGSRMKWRMESTSGLVPFVFSKSRFHGPAFRCDKIVVIHVSLLGAIEGVPDKDSNFWENENFRNLYERLLHERKLKSGYLERRIYQRPLHLRVNLLSRMKANIFQNCPCINLL